MQDRASFWELLHEFARPPTDERSAGAGYSYVERRLTKLGEGGAPRMHFLISGVVSSFKPELFYSIPETLPARQATLDFEASRKTERPAGLPRFFVTTSSGLLAALRMQQAYVSSTLSGVLMALALALLSLLVFVGNALVALLAFCCICAIVVCTLGLMVLLGWSLGPIEAICATIVVGFSVDYVVHYALAYVEAAETKRAQRLTRALVDVEISVESGALTTMGASVYLLATKIQFFFKVGRPQFPRPARLPRPPDPAPLLARVCRPVRRAVRRLHAQHARGALPSAHACARIAGATADRAALPVRPLPARAQITVANLLFVALLAQVGPEDDDYKLSAMWARRFPRGPGGAKHTSVAASPAAIPGAV